MLSGVRIEELQIGDGTIAGLSWAVEGMRVGGRRRLRVGPHLAYREHGVPGVVPPNAIGSV